MFSMVVPNSEWPTWVRVVAAAPLAFFAGALCFGWWPKNTREWRFFGAALACFTAFSVLMICVFHYA